MGGDAGGVERISAITNVLQLVVGVVSIMVYAAVTIVQARFFPFLVSPQNRCWSPSERGRRAHGSEESRLRKEPCRYEPERPETEIPALLKKVALMLMWRPGSVGGNACPSIVSALWFLLPSDETLPAFYASLDSCLTRCDWQRSCLDWKSGIQISIVTGATSFFLCVIGLALAVRTPFPVLHIRCHHSQVAAALFSFVASD
eukprot:1662317-Rhodomonas_salina.1